MKHIERVLTLKVLGRGTSLAQEILIRKKLAELHRAK